MSEEEDNGDFDDNNNINGRIVSLPNNLHWYIHNMNSNGRDGNFVQYSMSPQDEISHESYLDALLSDSDFDVVLDAIGTALRLSSLAVYHVSFVAAFGRDEKTNRGGGGGGRGGYSHRRRDYFVPAIADTDGAVYNVIVPLLLEHDDVPTPALVVWDDVDEEMEEEDSDGRKRRGGGKYEYQYGVGVVMGDDVVYDTMHDDYYEIHHANSVNPGHSDEDDDIGIRRNGGGRHINMRLFASVYIAEIDHDNVALVAKGVETMARSTIFPLRGDDADDERWLLSQEARHWRGPTYSDTNRDGKVTKAHTITNDAGRKAFRVKDARSDCRRRADDGSCGMPGVDVDEWVRATRKLCPFACGLYIEEGLAVAIEWLGAGDNIAKDDRAMMPVHQQQRSVRVCRRIRTGRDECLIYEDDVDVPGDFVSPKLRPGELFPVIWRKGDDDDNGDDAADNGKHTTTVATDYAFQVGLPPELTTELLAYCDRLGVTEELRKLTGDNPLLASDSVVHKFHKMADGNDWYVQRPALKWTSNMHWISPADERTHEEYLDVLARGKFDVVLDAIGKHLGLEGLVAYHLTFIGVSHSEKGFMHFDSTLTGGSVYNVIIPLILEDDATPDPPPRSTMATRRFSGELAIMQEGMNQSSRYGAMKYRLGTAVMLGDEALHGTEACDYREKNGMRLAATVYIADITNKNAKSISKQTLTQIFPLADARWLIAEAGRHWVSENYDGRSLLHNKGRNYFPFRDLLPDCTARANEGKCISDIEVTRVKCVKSCGIYEPNKYVVYQYIDAFFDNLYDDENSCIDDSDECEVNARNDMCLTNPYHMEELGCNKSCLYCLTQGSRALFSLGVEQTIDESNDDAVANVMTMSELYFVKEVFVDNNLKNYRLACQNKDSLCAEWAAKGQCEISPGVPSGDMVKNCPAACRQCSMLDIRERCPVDEETNIFKPGDMNAMFERWLKEAGQDTTIFSRDNLPIGGTIPVGDLNVVISPYHDKTQLPKDEDEDEETMPALPWVVSIDGFLSEEECEKLIELGESIGYERSTEYDSDDASNHSISEGRTSYNTFCMEGCDDDPVVKGVIERMTKLTGIPYNNYEYLQLVRYETGQFYEEHHDLAPIHYTSSFGPRILTFFLYLNDATSGLEIGGGTAFRYLNFTATPKKGMALVWPSVMDNLEGIDDWTWHMARPVEKGVKYGANVWIHLRDYQNKPNYCDL